MDWQQAWAKDYEKLCEQTAPPEGLYVSLNRQRLFLRQAGHWQGEFRISSARLGPGEQSGSEQTPRGWHEIREKHGFGAPFLGVLSSRIFTGEVAQIEPRPIPTESDQITTRILWLSGLEPGFNQGPDRDSYQRYIYLHGTPAEGLLGQPASHGCLRLANVDILTLFECLPVGAPVWIDPVS